jgi:hypothetical protein
MKITRNQLVDMMLRSFGSNIITIHIQTEPKMRKTGNPFMGTVKFASYNGMVGFYYDAAVLRRLEKEGKSADSFRKGESWHEPVIVSDKLTPLCRHKTNGNLYLRFMINSMLSCRFDLNGQTIDREDLEPFLTDNSGSYENQGLDKPVRIITIKIDNVNRITMDGQTYELT